jgi:hypothetical protein
MNFNKKPGKGYVKHVIAISVLLAIGAMLYLFSCKAVESHFMSGYNIGKLTTYSDVIDHAGGMNAAATNEDTLSLLYEMRGGSALSYMFLESLYRTQQLDAKNISSKHPASLKEFDPTKLDLLVLDAAERLSDIEFEFYLRSKLKDISKKKYRFHSDDIQRDAYFYALAAKTHFSPYEIELMQQCESRLKDKFSNVLYRVIYSNDSGSCNDIFYTVMRSYEKRNKLQVEIGQ